MHRISLLLFIIEILRSGFEAAKIDLTSDTESKAPAKTDAGVRKSVLRRSFFGYRHFGLYYEWPSVHKGNSSHSRNRKVLIPIVCVL
jgi:hypothetical protein